VTDVSVPVIAIDGPSGSGKGTVARRVAAVLGFHLLDSGALYRLVGYAAGRAGVPLDDGAKLAAIARDLPVIFGETADGEESIRLSGEEVSGAIRTETAGAAASAVAVLPQVREALFARQRAAARLPGLVADGRDMGSVVFPETPIKVFLTASAEERARRRHKQLKDKGLPASLAALSGEIAERDRRDASRALAPLVAAEGALILDSTGLTPDEVVERVLQHARAHL